MAQLGFWFELLSKELSATAAGPLDFAIPSLRQEEVLDLSIGVLKRISSVNIPFFESVSLAGWSLIASVGTAGSVLAQESSFSIDATGKKLEGAFSLNTAGVSALTDNQEVYFELIFSNGVGYYGGRFPVKILKAVHTTGALIPIAGDRALGAAEAVRTYVLKEMRPGERIIWQSDSGRKFEEWVSDDGIKQFVEVV